ncbi:MAG: PAS domain S-box protein [Anaerolineae bacterium]|nr:PAS domain S-box protein [Anaerolineae bacterium]
MTYSLLRPQSSGELPDRSIEEAEGFVKGALDALGAHVAILDETGVIIHVNKAWRTFAEENSYAGKDYGIGSNYLKVCEAAARSSEEARAVAKGIRSVRQRETEEFHTEYPCHSPTERRWFVVRITRFNWYGLTRLVVAHQNITEVKRLQIEASNQQRWLNAILDNLVDGIVVFDERGQIDSINPAGAYIFGYERDELLGQPISRLLPALTSSPSLAALRDFVDHISQLGDEIDGRRRDGSIFPMYFAVSKINLDDRHIYAAIIQDFTERKFLEAQLWDKERLNLELEKERELRDLKNRFISMMSHDLKTPLASIRLANSFLHEYGDRVSEADKRESYNAIDQQVEYLTDLINDVMTISRTDFTGAELKLEQIDLETYCRDIIEEMQLANRMQCCLEFSGTDERVEAEVDKRLIRRAITNLLTNAIKYSPSPMSPVRMELRVEHDHAIIRVSDQGIGIPEDDLKRLFEPFHRASNVGSINGTGLGLAITKQAIDLHGGTIRVESQLGKGTTFTIDLPLKHT